MHPFGRIGARIKRYKGREDGSFVRYVPTGLVVAVPAGKLVSTVTGESTRGQRVSVTVKGIEESRGSRVVFRNFSSTLGVLYLLFVTLYHEIS